MSNNIKKVSIWNDSNIFSDDNHPKFKDIIIYYKQIEEEGKITKLGQGLQSFGRLQFYDKKMRTDELSSEEKSVFGLPRVLSILRAGVNQAMNEPLATRFRDLAVTSLEPTKMLEARNKDGKILGWEWNRETSQNDKRVLIIDGFRIRLPEDTTVPEKYNVWQRPSMLKIVKNDNTILAWYDVSSIHIDKFIAISQPIIARKYDSLYIMPQIREWVSTEAVNVVPTGYVFY